MKTKYLLTLIGLAALLALPACAAPPFTPTVYHSVTVNASGQLVGSDTNFFHANKARMQAEGLGGSFAMSYANFQDVVSTNVYNILITGSQITTPAYDIDFAGTNAATDGAYIFTNVATDGIQNVYIKSSGPYFLFQDLGDGHWTISSSLTNDAGTWSYVTGAVMQTAAGDYPSPPTNAVWFGNYGTNIAASVTNYDSLVKDFGWDGTYVWNNSWYPNGKWTNSNGNYITNWGKAYNGIANLSLTPTLRLVDGSSNVYVMPLYNGRLLGGYGIYDMTDTNNVLYLGLGADNDTNFIVASTYVPYFLDGKVYTNNSSAWIEVRSQISLSCYNGGSSVSLYIYGLATNVASLAPRSLNGTGTAVPMSRSELLSGFVPPGGTYSFTNTTPYPSASNFGAIGAGQVIYFGAP